MKRDRAVEVMWAGSFRRRFVWLSRPWALFGAVFAVVASIGQDRSPGHVVATAIAGAAFGGMFGGLVFAALFSAIANRYWPRGRAIAHEQRVAVVRAVRDGVAPPSAELAKDVVEFADTVIKANAGRRAQKSNLLMSAVFFFGAIAGAAVAISKEEVGGAVFWLILALLNLYAMWHQQQTAVAVVAKAERAKVLAADDAS